MQPHSITPPSGLVVAYGFGVKVCVQHNHLFISSGIGPEREEHRLHRATSGLSRLIVLSTNGYISLDAFQWLRDVGASLMVIGSNGDVLLSDGPRRNSPDLRRAQVTAAHKLEIARDLIAAKIEGQAETLAYMGADPHPVKIWLTALAKVQTFEDVRSVESRAAVAYWQTWRDVPVRFSIKKLVPQHWRTFGQRVSHITHTPRRASTPGNALLNYAYAVLQGETRLAVLAMGLEPAWGFLHTDDDALVYDLMEPARPLVDRWLYDWLREQLFLKEDFSEDERGAVRLSYPLRRLISTQAFHFKEAVAPVIERVARRLDPHTPTLLTGEKRGRAVPVWSPEITLIARCSSCGVTVEPGRMYCDTCLLEHEAEKLERFINAGSQAQRTHGGTSGQQKGEANRRHHEKNAAVDGDAIRAEYDWNSILKSIETVSVRTLARDTGLSLRYVSLIRRGLQIPHPRHWTAFARVGQDCLGR